MLTDFTAVEMTASHLYSLRLQALRVGQLMEKRHRDHSPSSSEGAPMRKIRCKAAPRSCMPYNTYWARKIAI